MNNKKIFPSNFLQVIIFIILSFLCVFIVYQFDSNILNNYSLPFRMAFETLFFILLPLLLFLGINYKKNLKINFYYNKNLISLFVLGSFIVSPVILFSFSMKSLFNSDIQYFSPYTYNNIWMLIATCLIGPILEEIYFREIIQKGLSQSYSPKVSIILTSFIFTVVHMPSQYPLALFISLFLGYSYHISKNNISLVILLHLFSNNFSSFLEFIFSRFEVHNVSLISISIIIFSLSFYFFIKNVNNNKNLFYRS